MMTPAMNSPCPGDPDGHVWSLHFEERWYEVDPEPRKWTVMRVIGYTVGILVPIIGWILVLADLFEDKYVALGNRRKWYCVKCRTFETTKTTYEEEQS